MAESATRAITEIDTNRACRLCGERTEMLFNARVLGKHDVAYHECSACGSLQTDAPFWLAEAYASGHLSSSDAGAVVRNLYGQAYVYTIARALRLAQNATVLDFGGGNGLFCRLLRDIGFEARRLDTFAVNDFAQTFDDNGATYDIVCAFEVVEHFANPSNELLRIFTRAQELVIISTQIYDKQGREWWYLVPESGQHVFFYSSRAMRNIATKFGFYYFQHGELHIFSRKPLTKKVQFILHYALSNASQKWVRAYLGYRLSYDSAARDSGLFST
jgi:hypothetical protein